ncbi:hypothetical protein LPJ66_000867 [Kickxella alabastrina]|uniref:Uncharacterized protein n=1 Tax=Kickxella alabastrina TaxID=61397 RepID=A0ACC1IUT3_9FUNG|nr:hypothetical protein LPJ66_000867 [Kickxella alabastrina]
MADFGFDWGAEEEEEEEEEGRAIEEAEQTGGNSQASEEPSGAEGTPANGRLPPGVVVHRVAASDKQANPHGTTESSLIEPMLADAAKQQEAHTLEAGSEENMSALEIFCQRAASVFIFQRVWAAKEVGRLLEREPRRNALGVLVPIAMQLAEDRELFVRETMAQNLQPVLHVYFGSTDADAVADTGAGAVEANAADGAMPQAEAFDAWLHRVLLTPHPSVSLPAQRAAVALGRQLSFDAFHTRIVHGVVLSLVQNPVHQHLARQRERSKDMVIKTRASSPPAPVSTPSAGGGVLATLFGRRSWQGDKASAQSDKEPAQSDTADDGAAGLDALMGTFFVSPADEEARLELTRRKLLMLHMIHLVSVEFGAAMRPAVFVPVVERAAKDRAFEVRRDAAAVLGSLARAVSADLAVDVLFQCFLQLTQDPVWQVRQSAARHALPGLALVLAARAAEVSIERGDPAGSLAAFMYANQPPRPVADRQWLQLIERLAGPREPSHHVRAAVFESIGKLALALVDCARSRDALMVLVVGDVQRAHSDTGSGRFGLFGSNTSLQDLDDDDDDEEADDEVAEPSSVMTRALGTIQGVSAAASAPKPVVLGSALALAASSSVAASAGRGKDAGRRQHGRAVGRDVLYQCAFNFPAVLASAGVAGWDRLRDVFMQLSKTEHFEARQTLACSLHEVARILAASKSENASHSSDLESILCLFLIDGAEIKMGALRHLGDTLAWLVASSRVRCLPMIMQVFKHDGKQWRTRELMASQLVKLCHLFPAAIVVGSLLPQAVEWAHDPVAGVRAAVAPAFPIVFELTKLDPSTQVKFFETVISFSHAATFRGRLFFIEICSALLAHDQDPDADPVDFDQFFLPSLAALASDRVANVRIALARLVRRMLENRMRRQSISTTLADMWVAVCPPTIKLDTNGTDAADKSLRRITSEALIKSPSAESAPSTAEPPLAGSMTEAGPAAAAADEANSRFYAHRSLGSVARRPRRNTTPMRAHLLAMMVQQLAKDTDRDVLDLVRDLPGMPISAAILSPPPLPSANSGTVEARAPREKEVAANNTSSLIKTFPQPPPSPPMIPSDCAPGMIDFQAENKAGDGEEIKYVHKEDEEINGADKDNGDGMVNGSNLEDYTNDKGELRVEPEDTVNDEDINEMHIDSAVTVINQFKVSKDTFLVDKMHSAKLAIGKEDVSSPDDDFNCGDDGDNSDSVSALSQPVHSSGIPESTMHSPRSTTFTV